MPEDLHDFVFFSKNFDRASGTLVPFLSEAQVNYAHGRKTQETVTHFLGRNKKSLKIAKTIEQHEIITTQGIIPVLGALQILEKIHPEHLAIVTSASRELCINRLQAAGLPCPKFIVSAEDVICGKPDPEGYFLGAQLLGLAIEDILIFEDAQAGIQAALKTCASLAIVGSCDASAGKELARIPDFTKIQIMRSKNRYMVMF
ncbi:HAD-IA family hydrolase [Xenorhabdus sp. Sc-CR9]|uniref:HAD-IA family hydrolase n=1 Tax=Xenorhabdus sp. Sc-CR9 TaxID=2584468 RepID=UPI001F0213BD|nr:HAD-IA family hydrolase [Xenorhabdus sp. Sc-CR9]